jgi:hypothetical protein
MNSGLFCLAFQPLAAGLDRELQAVGPGRTNEVPPVNHKFSIEQNVIHQPRGPLVDRSKSYTIVSLLPVESDGQYRYRIKCASENFERIVVENELSRDE